MDKNGGNTELVGSQGGVDHHSDNIIGVDDQDELKLKPRSTTKENKN